MQSEFSADVRFSGGIDLLREFKSGVPVLEVASHFEGEDGSGGFEEGFLGLIVLMK